MAPRIKKDSKVHTIRKILDQDLFPGSPSKRSLTVSKNENGTVESVKNGVASVTFHDIGWNWLIDVELLKAGWYDKKSK